MLLRRVTYFQHYTRDDMQPAFGGGPSPAGGMPQQPQAQQLPGPPPMGGQPRPQYPGPPQVRLPPLQHVCSSAPVPSGPLLPGCVLDGVVTVGTPEALSLSPG